jgi:hypothetical protein
MRDGADADDGERRSIRAHRMGEPDISLQESHVGSDP